MDKTNPTGITNDRPYKMKPTDVTNSERTNIMNRSYRHKKAYGYNESYGYTGSYRYNKPPYIMNLPFK